MGREYWHQYIDNRGPRPLYHNEFCYGPIVVERVKDFKKYEYTRAKGYSYNEVQLEVYYEYHVIEVPDWVINNKDKIKAIYGASTVELPGKTNEEVVRFYVGKDDKIYQNSLSYFQFKP